jgi:hypothetical protein
MVTVAQQVSMCPDSLLSYTCNEKQKQTETNCKCASWLLTIKDSFTLFQDV